MATFYSPSGNPEVWEEKPDGYLTPEEWAALHPPPPAPEPTTEEIIAQYNAAIENKLNEEKTARGYTMYDPTSYADSSVPRYKQDSIDWVQHRDEVMVQGLTILNYYLKTKEIPSIEDFVNILPSIWWTVDPRNENPAEGMEIRN